MPKGDRLLADIRPLRESAAFRRLWAGTTLSSVGGALTSFAVILQVYDLTHSPFAVGVIGVAQMVPTLVIGLLSGVVADATDRRKLVLVTSGGLAAVSAAFAAQAFAGLRLVWLLYVLVAVKSSLGAVGSPARSTLIPSLLPASQVPAGLMLNRLSFQIMMTAGPALAGLIAAVPQLGLRACYLIDAVSFAASLYAAARLPAMRAGLAFFGITTFAVIPRARAAYPTAIAWFPALTAVTPRARCSGERASMTVSAPRGLKLPAC